MFWHGIEVSWVTSDDIGVAVALMVGHFLTPGGIPFGVTFAADRLGASHAPPDRRSLRLSEGWVEVEGSRPTVKRCGFSEKIQVLVMMVAKEQDGFDLLERVLLGGTWTIGVSRLLKIEQKR